MAAAAAEAATAAPAAAALDEGQTVGGLKRIRQIGGARR
jgi:hypothetical protein